MTANVMSSILFDTHAYVKKLIAVGFTEPQAETLASEQAGMIENKLATKQDFEKFRKETKQELSTLEQKIDTLESNVKRDMRELEMRMTIKLGLMLLVGFSIFTTILKFII